MHYFEYATKDTTLYEASASMNTGLDEIIEVRKDMNKDGSVINISRALIHFDLTYISESVASSLITNPTYYLNLYDANSENLNVSQTLYGYPVSQSWTNGSGKYLYFPTVDDGASWKYRDGDLNATPWFGSYSTLQGDTYASGTLTISNGDFDNQEVTIGGVDFVFVSGSTSVFDNSSTEIFVTSGSTTGSSINNLRNTINASSSLHGLPISASLSGSDSSNWTYLILSGSSTGTSSNLTAASSSVLFTFDGDATKALEGGTDTTSVLSGGGGTWFSGSGYEASQSFTHEPSDLRMDVTDIVNKWLESTVPNEGFMIKRSGSLGNSDTNVEEGNVTRYGNFIFFGRDTHTVYQPKLEVVWDDSKWATGSLSALSNTEVEDMVLYMRGFRPEYKETSKVKFRVVGRTRYPEKTFSSTGYSTGYTTAKYLPSGSTYYQIKDAYTEDVIVPFGSGSIVSCDSTGNYFNLWMNGLQAERFYRINYKVVSGSGTADETVQYFDEKHSFKVVR
jgi:hypothetical protein